MQYDRRQSWFLAQLKPNSSSIAQKNLSRQGFQSFLPQEEVDKRRGSKFVAVCQPLFPGYLFVAFDKAWGHWRKVNSTFGITRLVSFGNEPAQVPLDLISQLMLRCDQTGKLLPPKLVKPGDQVTVTQGPFADFVGEVEMIAPDRRVWVLMEIMGGKKRVALQSEQLRAG